MLTQTIIRNLWSR